MRRGTLLPDTAEVELGFLRPKDGTIQMHLRACRASAVCPECQTISWRVHSRYARELGDLPGRVSRSVFTCRLGSSFVAGGLAATHFQGAAAQHGCSVWAEDAGLLRRPGFDPAGFRRVS